MTEEQRIRYFRLTGSWIPPSGCRIVAVRAKGGDHLETMCYLGEEYDKEQARAYDEALSEVG